ncbi:MAG TPA: Spy/CpxP family protein refolding chaperone [Rhodanobacteraceae bacterium]|nr:Spy/CpxP family protein refolding chaperone [Rhodanobacteraceae bacterium]
MRKTLLSLIGAVAIGGSALALAAPGGPGFGHGDHGHGMTAMHELGKLDLSDAQRASIKQFSKQTFQQVKPQMQALHQQREAFESLAPTASGYQAAANSLADAEAAATRTHVLQEASLRAQVYNILTPAQRNQLASDRAQHEARMQQWKEFQAQHPLPSGDASAQ